SYLSIRYPEVRAISAFFTRVFDALWRASKDARPRDCDRPAVILRKPISGKPEIGGRAPQGEGAPLSARRGRSTCRHPFPLNCLPTPVDQSLLVRTLDLDLLGRGPGDLL